MGMTHTSVGYSAGGGEKQNKTKRAASITSRTNEYHTIHLSSQSFQYLHGVFSRSYKAQHVEGINVDHCMHCQFTTSEVVSVRRQV